jgi:DNA-directed RNA polymerase specialized sigma24 family protein
VTDARQRRVEEVFRAHHGAVTRYALRRVDDGPRPTDAQDAVAETFTIARRRGEAAPGEAPDLGKGAPDETQR